MKRRRWFGRGVLAAIAVVLIASGLLRTGLGIGAAMARAPDASAAPLQCPEPPLAVAEALKTRENRVQAAEMALADRQAALDLATASINARMAELKTAEDELSSLITVADGAAEQDLARLTAVYEAMKPSDAARLFAAMEPDFAAGFLGRMAPEAAANVLAGLPPDTAYAVTALIAGRNARAPSE